MVELNPASIALAACGIVCCFFGYRTAKLLLDVSGFVVLGLVASLAVGFFSDGNLAAMLGALVAGGILGAVIAHLAYRAGVMLFGCGVCALAAWNWAQLSLESGGILAAVVLGGLVGGLAAFFLERFTVSLITAGLGAWFTVQGVFLLLEEMGVTPEKQETGSFLDSLPSWLFAWLALTVVGFLFQLVAGKLWKTSG